MTKTLEQFVNELKNTYKVDVEVVSGGNQFIDQTLKIRSGNKDKLLLYLGFNDEDQASILQIESYKDAGLNLAEGYTSDQILDVTTKLIEGMFEYSGTGFFKKRQVLKIVAGNETILFEKK